ncbi:MAG: LuxR C-terminal-related transcriptional regulator [Bacteroidales bacterium]|nr:LuxR C-terminal-related transcriptional regulator [Bacteroidales bacterium]
MHIMRQTTFFEIDDKDKPVSMISVCSDISYIKSDNRIGWQLIGPGTDGFDLSGLFCKVVPAAGFSFSQRELNILKDLTNGLQSKEIAEKRFISKHTVDTHRRRILKKTGLSNTLELVLFAIRNNIVVYGIKEIL